MIPFQLRLILLFGAIFAVWVVCSHIKKNKILIESSVFWVVGAFILLVMAVFPQLPIVLAGLLGFMSPSNFVYLVVIALLLWKTFTNSAEISRLKAKVNDLAQEIALREIDHKDAGGSQDATSQDGIEKSEGSEEETSA